MKKVAVILSGCGVYDGSEIHEAVFTLLSLEQQNTSYECFAPDKDQLHVVNHITGKEMNESRNVLVESARIARGDIKPLNELQIADFDGLAFPGGFGAAKNLNQWAISGPNGAIDLQVKDLILQAIEERKALLALCMGPTVVAKALEGSKYKAKLTVGSDVEASPYEIAAISQGMESIGAEVAMKTLQEVMVDEELKIVSAPCYMMEGSISDIFNNIQSAVKRFAAVL
ncbi:MAG: isoprenoid biosynthesis glyoxalase ElbB [Luteibaculum sp.]